MTTLTGTLVTDLPPSEAPGDAWLLSWIPDDEVPASHRAFVAAHARRLAKRHRLGPIRVRYFGEPRPSHPQLFGDQVVTRGDFYQTAQAAGELPVGIAPDDEPDVIGINAGLRGAAVVAHTVAHEVAHVILRRRGVDQDEAWCDRFASRYTERRTAK